MLVVRRKTPGAFPQNTVELIKTFAAQSALAIENARLFENVEASLEDLRTAQDRLVQTEKLASLGQLTAGIAHQITICRGWMAVAAAEAAGEREAGVDHYRLGLYVGKGRNLAALPDEVDRHPVSLASRASLKSLSLKLPWSYLPEYNVGVEYSVAARLP